MASNEWLSMNGFQRIAFNEWISTNDFRFERKKNNLSCALMVKLTMLLTDLDESQKECSKSLPFARLQETEKHAIRLRWHLQVLSIFSRASDFSLHRTFPVA